MIQLHNYIAVAVYSFKYGEANEAFLFSIPVNNKDPKNHISQEIKCILDQRKQGQIFKYITDLKKIVNCKIQINEVKKTTQKAKAKRQFRSMEKMGTQIQRS